MSGFDRRQVGHAFSRAAAQYDSGAALQRRIGEELLESIDYIEDPIFHPEPVEVILDLGSGTGNGSRWLQTHFPQATVLSLDLAMGMLRQAHPPTGMLQSLRNRLRKTREPHPILADARALPVADHSVDLIHSNLCLQWVEDLPTVLNGFRRVLKPGGMLLFSTFGPMTLYELRMSFAQADDEAPHVSPFADIQQWGDALVAAGFRNPVLDRDLIIEKHPSFQALLRSLKTIGATNAMSERRRSLTGKSRFARAAKAYAQWSDPTTDELPASWEVIRALAWAPPMDAPIRHAGMDEVRVPVSSLKVRRRDPESQ